MLLGEWEVFSHLYNYKGFDAITNTCTNLCPCGIIKPFFILLLSQELVFSSGQLERVINVTVIDDVIPEVDERFCVQLSLPEGGATLGSIPQSKMDRSHRYSTIVVDLY